MMRKRMTRRGLLLKAAGAAVAAPYVITSGALGGSGRPAASERIVMGCIGVGGRGMSDMNGALQFPEVQMVAVCDVVAAHRDKAQAAVDKKYGSAGCAACADFRDIVTRKDIDAVLIATPDHWHAIISIMAMRNGKDVFCEKPETLTVREGRAMVETARRYGRVFSGGSQRVWGDYNWFHKMVRGGAIGKVREVWVNVGETSCDCTLSGEPVPPGVDWDLWLGQAPWRPFHPTLIRGGFRPWREYSGGGMTDWGCHGFGGALFALGLHETGPVEVIPPDGKDHPYLTYVFADGLRMYHKGGWGGILSFRGDKGEIPPRNARTKGKDKSQLPPPPNIYIPNYKGKGGIFGDFLHCVRTRQRPFRDIEIAHRTASHCHIGNIAYWLGRPLKWDSVREQFIGDDLANRWLERPMREPWRV